MDVRTVPARRREEPVADAGGDPGLVFTAYVRALAPGGRPSPELAEAFWRKLRDALAAELRRRSLWSASPGHLGLHGAGAWTDEAVDEVAVDLYAYLLDRLQHLHAQLKVKPNVEGLVFRNLHNYLYDTQKKHDPLGFRTFAAAQAAARRLIAAGTLQVLAGDPGVRNDTVLGFAPEAGPGDAAGDAAFAATVRSWNDDLLPDLVTARGRRRDEVALRLARHVAALPAAGVAAFRFRDLVAALKGDARARWSAVWSQQQGETALEEAGDDFVAVVRTVRPDPRIDERNAFAKTLACMAEALEHRAESPATRDYLGKLWDFLCHHAAAGQDDELPSARRIARLLGIPRDRLPGLRTTLGEWLEECRGRPGGQRRKPAVKSS